MLAQVLGWQRVELYTHFEDEVGERPAGRFRELVRRRAEGTPVAYLVGRKEFYSLAFDGLARRADPPARIGVRGRRVPGPDQGARVAPRASTSGTGSGCLRAWRVPSTTRRRRFVAIDISPEALAVAGANAAHHGVADRIDFRLGDRLEPVAAKARSTRSSPTLPTSRPASIPTLEPGVRDYEPQLALDGGPDGLGMVAPLIEEAVPLLKPGGHLILEIGTDQEEPVRALIEAQPAAQAGTDGPRPRQPPARHPRHEGNGESVA